MTAPSYIKPKKEKSEEVLSGSRQHELGVNIMSLKSTKKELEETLTETNKEIDALETELTELMETSGVDLFRVAGVGTFFTQEHYYPTVNDKESFASWLDENGEGAIAVRSVHPQTLKSWVKARLAEGLELPPMVTNFIKRRVNTRKA